MNKALAIWSAFWHRRSLWCSILFIVLLGFVDDNCLMNLLTLQHENNRLKAEVEKYERNYNEALKQLRTIEHSQDAVEHIARTRLQMKADDEDVYIIE